MNIAVVLDMEEDGRRCRDARITVGAISPSPVRMVKAEDAIRGQNVSKNLFEEAAGMVTSNARPFMHHGYSASYLRECLRAQARRALETAYGRVRSS